MPFPGPVPNAPNSGNPATFNEDADIFLGWMNLFGNWLEENLYPNMAVRPIIPGTAAAPVYSRDADTNTGVYFPAADQLGFSTGGALRVSVTNTALVLAAGVALSFPAGTAAAPVLAPSSDPNTGVFFPAEDTIGLAAGGISRVTMSGSAITSTLPLYAPSGTLAAPALAFAGDTDTGIYRPAADQIGLVTGGAARVRISSTLLDVLTPTSLSAGSVAAPSVFFATDSTSGFYRAGVDQIGLSILGERKWSVSNLIMAVDVPLRGIDRTASSPMYSFNSDPNTGMYLNAADVLGFSAGGADKLLLGASDATFTTTALFQAGTVAAPGIAFGLSPDIGFYRPGTGSLAVSIGGVTQFQWTSGGNFRMYNADGTFHAGFVANPTANRTYNFPDGNVTIPSGTLTPDSRTISTGNGLSGGGNLSANRTLSIDTAVVMDLSSTQTVGGVKSFTLPIRAADGIASTPGYGFASDTNTGMYLAGADTLSFTTGGGPRLTLNNTSAAITVPLTVANGTAATPSINFASDPDTGIFRVGTDTIGFANGGTVGMVLTSNSRLRLYNTAGTFYSEIVNEPTAHRSLTLPDANVVLVGGTMVPTARTVATGNGLSGGGDLSANRSLSIDTAVVATLNSTQTFTAAKTFNQRSTFQQGTAAAPAIVFAGDNASGLYTTGSNIVGISTQGSQSLLMDSRRIYFGNHLLTDPGGTGNTSYGVTIDGPTGVFSSNANGPNLRLAKPVAGNVAQFMCGTTSVGQITMSTSSTSYGTASDYRLKQDIREISDPVGRVKALNPIDHQWASDLTRSEGFLAHELAEILPTAVTGKKDEIDPETSEPIYQSVDYSKVVPLLVAALQKAFERIEQLEDRLDELPGTPT